MMILCPECMNGFAPSGVRTVKKSGQRSRPTDSRRLTLWGLLAFAAYLTIKTTAGQTNGLGSNKGERWHGSNNSSIDNGCGRQ